MVAAMTLLSDEELMGLVQGGDHEAFNELYRRWSRSILTYCRRRLRSWDDADEVTNETFLRVYGLTRRYSVEAGFRAFIFAVAKYAVFNHYRELWRHRRIARSVPAAKDSPDHVPAIMAAERDAIVRQRLPHVVTAKQFETIKGSWLADVNGREYAETSDVTHQAVYQRLNSAYRAIEADPVLAQLV